MAGRCDDGVALLADLFLPCLLSCFPLLNDLARLGCKLRVGILSDNLAERFRGTKRSARLVHELCECETIRSQALHVVTRVLRGENGLQPPTYTGQVVQFLIP